MDALHSRNISAFCPREAIISAFLQWISAFSNLTQAHGLIANASRKLQAAELNYPTHDREGLALVYCIDKFRCYLQGSQFKVCTDNKALEYPLSKKNLTG
jgi:hypothetical protein